MSKSKFVEKDEFQYVMLTLICVIANKISIASCLGWKNGNGLGSNLEVIILSSEVNNFIKQVDQHTIISIEFIVSV